jgi:hypothetical protein
MIKGILTMTVVIPDRMKNLELDPRGYPIPWGVYRDKDGRAHFTINDDRRRYAAIKGNLCPICSFPLFRGRWFVGGPISAFHEHGAYADPPMHHECATYALQVCPYLASPRYARRIEDRTLMQNDATPILVDPTMIERRPELFISAMATRQRVTKGFSPNVIPGKPFVRIEYWQAGKQLNQAEGESLVEAERSSWPAIIAKRSLPRLINKGISHD